MLSKEIELYKLVKDFDDGIKIAKRDSWNFDKIVKEINKSINFY